MSYYVFYLTKVNKRNTKKNKTNVNKTKLKHYNTSKNRKHIFICTSMFVQQAIHLAISMPLHPKTRSFQTCHEHQSTSLIDRYINHQYDYLHDICLVEFATNYDVKTSQ